MATTSDTAANHQALYEPLCEEKLEIRLLDLEPSVDHDSDLRCQLRTVSIPDLAPALSERRSFEALSYTWGDASSPRHVYVNGHPIKVTQNLESFLRNRREVDNMVTLWIDAIVINQEDKLEKNYLIPLMNLIYTGASKLMIWLGPSSDDSSLAFECLKHLGAGSPYSKMPLLRRKDFTALQNLLSRPWWTRTWIIQELVAGGMGPKKKALTIQCGSDSALWIDFVIAAARLKAHLEDLRQPCPNVDNILELDSLRESAFNFLINAGPTCTYFDLLCRYRHCLSTDPRDKLYAIYNMFAGGSRDIMPARYDASVETVYIDFALEKIRTENDLEILRHCGQSQHRLPSWVPDWSTGLGTQLLPLKKIPRYLNVPWWAYPVQLESGEQKIDRSEAEPPMWQFQMDPFLKDATEAAYQRKVQLRRLEIDAKGFGMVEDFDEIPPGFSIHTIPDDVKGVFREALNLGVLAMSVQDERCLPVKHEKFQWKRPDALRQGEIMTERSMKRWLLQELTGSGVNPQYLAARETKADIKIDDDQSVLKVKGILWETIDVCHEGFVEDLTTDWKDTTRFLVAVGLCKALALAQRSAVERYPAIHEAFWSTLFVGQVINQNRANEGQASQRPLSCAEWLPEVPSNWTVTDPPLTATTCGFVDLSERLQAVDDVMNAPRLGDDGKPQPRKYQVNSMSYDEYDPKRWPDGEQKRHKADLIELASMWHQQPYDLYHRPFAFLHIVPDPYWETRKDQDELARQRSRQYREAPIISQPPPGSRGKDKNGKEKKPMFTYRELQDQSLAIEAELMNRTSLVPRGTMKDGIEQYALGRQFFVTRGGYFGLGPKGIRKGDRVAVLFGSNVPFILRKHDAAGSGLGGWQLIGETYVHGAMKGEVIGLWELGALEAGTLSLR